ncbi:transmembrane protein, putative (macronuclear) [Tetrahymena thermophila SB210]|uniref:Transmembrane protein, putative n=1 Tax=Tetrahymena thermophila (strain SB210) TaxID=312017 RepID=W7X384_TETTS|nr:transmembrane protein, putative [Tetrahymena thermophila SB210]EWS73755.1 transmembrane protein, putative [Tetrahymena thermophila SB210]|eukprot:XP_012653719.1 transmembrane protein, putative [Tetrahymena thermophila SB210]
MIKYLRSKILEFYGSYQHNYLYLQCCQSTHGQLGILYRMYCICLLVLKNQLYIVTIYNLPFIFTQYFKYLIQLLLFFNQVILSQIMIQNRQSLIRSKHNNQKSYLQKYKERKSKILI